MAHAIVYYGTFIHSVSLTELEVLANTLVGVDETGVIRFVEKDVEKANVNDVRERHQAREWEVVSMAGDGSEFWFPGFVGEFWYSFRFGKCKLCVLCCFHGICGFAMESVAERNREDSPALL